MEQQFRREIQVLDAIFDFLDAGISSYGLNDSLAFTLKFAVEEIFTNMVKYNPRSPEDIRIAMNVRKDSLILQLIDFETEPFDITKTEEVNVTLPIDERKPGGLGIHLVKAMVDKVDFEHIGNKSTITLTLKLER